MSNQNIQWLKWEDGTEWGEIECTMLNDEMVMTYYLKGRPCFYSYTAPFVTEDGSVCYYRFDHDEGWWDEDTMFFLDEEYTGDKYYLGGVAE